MHVAIDMAEPDDAPFITKLVGELLWEIMEAIGSRVFSFNESETDARLRAWIRDGKYAVFLARQESKESLIGFVTLYESYALYAGGTFGTIPEFYVRPAYRSKGVGAVLLERVKDYGRTKRWSRLEATTPPLPQFERTFSFYRREGFHVSGGSKMKIDLE
jgi:GNAT superfamily N-acetyltransferase